MYYVIVNPAAGNGRGLLMAECLKRMMDESGNKYEMFYTKEKQDAAKLAERSCCKGGKAIISIGGDGTVQEIVSGMFSTEKNKPLPLGILPCGSGNDFIRSLDSDIKKIKGNEGIAAWLMSVIKESRTRLVDVIRINDTACLNISNIGLDALIVQNAASLKKTFGRNAYLAAAFKSIVQYKNIRMQIEINGESLHEEFTLAAICNGQYYGGGMRIAPHASVDDGLITLCLVRCKTQPKLMMLFPTILIEKHMKLNEVQYMQCKSMTIKLDKNHYLCLDGNLYEMSGELHFKIIPKALCVFT